LVSGGSESKARRQEFLSSQVGNPLYNTITEVYLINQSPFRAQHTERNPVYLA
jgi:hypothetical protein